MYVLRLFHRDRPAEQVDVRVLGEGRLTLGRDPASDWPLEDPNAALSRLHCVLSVEAGRLMLSDKSSNGVFLDGTGRIPFDTPVELRDGQAFQLGALSVRVERLSEQAVDASATITLVPGWSGPTPLQADWSDEAPAPVAHRDASLVEAFCEGALIDASTLSSEDPADLMRRIGAIYQQTVLGLAALMADRAKLKRDSELDRTTIAAHENNPFKWAPSRQVAQDLLCGHEAAFLSDAAAVRACFEDLSHHLAGVMAGAQAAVAAATEALDPTAIDAEARTQASLLRGRSGTAIDILKRRHAELVGGMVQHAFATAYQQSSDRTEPARMPELRPI